jgi:hypothetical protein
MGANMISVGTGGRKDARNLKRVTRHLGLAENVLLSGNKSNVMVAFTQGVQELNNSMQLPIEIDNKAMKYHCQKLSP